MYEELFDIHVRVNEEGRYFIATTDYTEDGVEIHTVEEIEVKGGDHVLDPS